MKELINKIIDIEESAKEVTKEAIEKRKNLKKEIDLEVESLKETFMEKAKRRIKMVEEAEKQEAQDCLDEVRVRQGIALKKIDELCKKNAQKWEDDIFAKIVK